MRRLIKKIGIELVKDFSKSMNRIGYRIEKVREDMDTILVEKRIAKTGKIAIIKVLNERMARAPIEVATPFPPLKERKGENI